MPKLLRSHSNPIILDHKNTEKVIFDLSSQNQGNLLPIVDANPVGKSHSSKRIKLHETLFLDNSLKDLEKAIASWQLNEISTLAPIEGNKAKSANFFGSLHYNNLQKIDSFLSPEDSFSLSKTCKLLAKAEAKSSLEYASVFTLTLDNITELNRKPSYSKVFLKRYKNIKMPSDISDSDFLKMSKNGLLENIETLDLSSCQQITSAGLSRLPRSLKSLTISSCPGINNDALDQISLLSELNSLEFGPSDQVTDDGLRSIGRMVNLTKLTVSRCPHLNHALFLQPTLFFGNLNYLSVTNCSNIIEPILGLGARALSEGREGNRFTLEIHIVMP